MGGLSADRDLALALEAELSNYMADEPDGWVAQASRAVVEAARLLGWAPAKLAVMPAEEEPEGCR